MTIEELAQELKSMWEGASEGEKTNVLRLFSIKYADHLPPRGNRQDIDRLLILAGLNTNLLREVQKGRDLAKYVEVKPEYR